MADQPTYYKITTDTDTLYELDNFNDDDAVRAVTPEQITDPFSEEHEDYFKGTTAGRATPEEVAEWTLAYNTLKEEADRIKDRLKAAEREWEQAQSRCMGAYRDAYNEYAPVHRVISERVEEVADLREQRRKAEAARLVAEAAAVQAKEDAELGARDWIVFQANGMSARVAPDMFAPVIHLATCPSARERMSGHGRSGWHFARARDVAVHLANGGREMSRGMPTGGTVPAKLCGRCKPEASLRAALGEEFEQWLVKAESVQKPMPNSKATPKALGLEAEWNDRYRKVAGYTIVSGKYQLAEKIIEPHEILIGWLVWKDNGESTVTECPPERMGALLANLPARGFIARRINEPVAFRMGEGVKSKTAVAVRRMTAHEIRQAKADAAATTAFREART